jgi:hypothetical protein
VSPAINQSINQSIKSIHTVLPIISLLGTALVEQLSLSLLELVLISPTSLSRLEAITDSWPAHTSYINWRWHVPAVLLALGDCDEALAYMHRVADKFRDRDGDAKAFSFAATATAFKWHKALAEFCLVSRKGGKPTFNRMSDFDGELATGELTLTPSLVDPTGDYSTLTGAFDLNPHVMECLAAGETRLPRLPMLPSMGLMQSVEQALVYCNGASKLWRSIPGALEW